MRFSARTIERIDRSVHVTEALVNASGPPHTRFDRTYADGENFQLFQLTAGLKTGGTAKANPYYWSAAAGKFLADSTHPATVIDKLGFYAPPQAIVACRYYGNSDCSTNYVVIAVLPGLSALCLGKTTAAVNATDATYTVNGILAAGAGLAPTNKGSDTMTIANVPWGLSGGTGWSCSGSGVGVMFVVSTISGVPGSGSNIGTGNHVTGPCGA